LFATFIHHCFSWFTWVGGTATSEPRPACLDGQHTYYLRRKMCNQYDQRANDPCLIFVDASMDVTLTWHLMTAAN
jgi:hypothetical protein